MEALQSLPLLHNLGYDRLRPGGVAKPIPALLMLVWRHYQTALDPKQLIDGMPLSEAGGIKPFGNAGTNYIDWLIANASNATALERQDFGARKALGEVEICRIVRSQLKARGQNRDARKIGDRRRGRNAEIEDAELRKKLVPGVRGDSPRRRATATAFIISQGQSEGT